MSKNNLNRFIPLFVISSLITGVCFFLSLQVSRENSPGGTVDWGFVWKFSGFVFLGTWISMGALVLLTRAGRMRRVALEKTMQSVANELGLDYCLDSDSDEIIVSGTLGEIPVTVAVRKPVERKSHWDESVTDPYTFFMVSIPGEICDARLCTKASSRDAEHTLTEAELLAKKEQLKNIRVPGKMKRLRINASSIICSLEGHVLPIMRSRDEISYGLKALRRMAEILSASGSCLMCLLTR